MNGIDNSTIIIIALVLAVLYKQLDLLEILKEKWI